MLRMWMECMLVDRCPTCQGTMVFHAITVGKTGWRRWAECVKCSEVRGADSYVSYTVDGDVDVKSSTPPPKAILARNEEYNEAD